MFYLFRRSLLRRSENFLAYVSVNSAGLGLFFKAISYTVVFDCFFVHQDFTPEISSNIWFGFGFAIISVLCYQISDAADSVLEDRE